MKVFKDKTGMEWEIVIDVSQMKAVKSALGVNLYALVEDGAKPLAELLEDPCKLVDVLYVLCREQCKERCFSDEQFGKGFSGDSLEQAADAFVEELILFFPQEKVRTAVRRLMEKSKELAQRLMERGTHRLNEVDLDGLVDELELTVLAKANRERKELGLPPLKLKGSSGNAPDNAESTQVA